MNEAGIALKSSMGSAARFSLRLLLLLLFALLIVFALLTAVLRLGSPYVSSYKTEMEAWVSDYLRTPVEIGSMDFTWRAASPSITLDDVALLSVDDNTVPLKLEKILLDLDLLKTIFVDGWHINEVTISGADLTLEYLGAQKFRVSGVDLGQRASQTSAVDGSSQRIPEENSPAPEIVSSEKANESSDSNDGFAVMSWLLNSRRVGLVDSRIKLLDATRGIDYQIEALNIRAENNSKLHQLRVDMRLPPLLGDSFEIDVDLDAVDLDIASNPELLSEDLAEVLSGVFYFSGENLRLQNWADLWPDRNIDLEGVSDLKLWGSWQGDRIMDARGQVAGTELSLGQLATVASSPDTLPPAELLLESLQADVNWRRRDDGWVTQLDQLNFRHDGTENSLVSTELSVLDSKAGRSWRLDSGGDQLNLSALAAITATLQDVLPLGEIPDSISTVSPKGKLTDWKLSLSKGMDVNDSSDNGGSIPQLTFQGKLAGLNLQQHGSIPALSGVDAQFDVRKNEGTVNVEANDLKLRHPAVFPEDLELQSAIGEFAIRWTDREFSLGSENIEIVDQGLTAVQRLSLQKLPEQSTQIELQGDFELQDLGQLPRYFPRGKIRDPLEVWLDNAFDAGSASNGKVLLLGELDRFPYSRGDGVFKVTMDVADASLDYSKTWPALSGIDASVTFDGPSMDVQSTAVKFGGTPLRSASASIDNLFKPLLRINSSARRPLQDYISFANNGPLQRILAPAFRDSSGTGDAMMRVNAQIPLRARKWREVGEVFDVNGHVELAQNSLQSGAFGMQLDNVSGRVNFTHNGFDIDQVKANYQGKPIDIGAHTTGSGKNRLSEINFSGVALPAKVLRDYGIPLDSFFYGESTWFMNVEVPHASDQSTRFSASSDLVGTAVTLPAPLSKAADRKTRVIVSSTIGKGQARQTWQVRYGKQLTANVRLGKSGGVEAMLLNFGPPSSGVAGNMPANGIRVQGTARKLAFDGWVEAVNTIIEALPASSGGPTPILPVSADLYTPQLIVGNTPEGPATVRANTDDVYINGVINSEILRGSIRIPRRHWDSDQAVLGRIAYAEKKLIDDLVAKSEANGTGKASPLDPRAFPRLNIHLARFRWDNLILSNVGFRSKPVSAGMKITTLGFAHDEGRLTGEGFWHWRDPQNLNASFKGQQITQLDLQLQSGDFGKTVAALGFSEAMAEGRGNVDLSVGWPGPLYAPDLADLSGEINLALRKGRILKVDPGAARMFGLFALQSIPRRLSLDFSDITNEGLEYDNISGKVGIEKGEAISQLVQLNGPVGVIDVTGSANFLDQTYAQRITVLPRISGALPIIGLISGGATAGIGALIAAPLLKALGIDIDKLGLSKYTVTGSWENPVIRSAGSGREALQ